jgi:hypothetical protein
MASLSHSYVSPDGDSPFTIDNIPFGVFSTKDDPTPRCATAIGEFAVDLRALSRAGFFSDVDDADVVTHALSQVRTRPYVRWLRRALSIPFSLRWHWHWRWQSW